MRKSSGIHLMTAVLSIMASAGILTGCGSATLPSAVVIARPTYPRWMTVWVPSLQAYVWLTPRTMPMLLITRQNRAAALTLHNRLTRIRAFTEPAVIWTNPPSRQPESTLPKVWTDLHLPIAEWVGPGAPTAAITWLTAGPHHTIQVTHYLPSVTALAQALHGTILSPTSSTPSTASNPTAVP